MTTLSILDMPILGTKQAPKKFKGDYRHVEDFINHYERLLQRCNVTDEKEKCHNLRQYCSSVVKETIEGMQDYITPDWTKLKAMILKFYDAERNEQRYTERDLTAFVRVTRNQQVSSVNGFRTYQRSFCRVGGWLRNQGKITDTQFQRYFWSGLPKKLRQQIEGRILQAKPNHDLSKPFDVIDIVAAVDKLFMRTRFDVNDSDNEIEVDWPESASDSDESSSDESEEEPKHQSRSKLKTSAKTKSSYRCWQH